MLELNSMKKIAVKSIDLATLQKLGIVNYSHESMKQLAQMGYAYRDSASNTYFLNKSGVSALQYVNGEENIDFIIIHDLIAQFETTEKAIANFDYQNVFTKDAMKRLQAYRFELYAKVAELREELQLIDQRVKH